MRIFVSIPAVQVVVQDAEGKVVLDYSMHDYKLDADTTGLVQAGFAIAAEVQKQIGALECSD